jgi:hypothetical protein
MSRTRAERKARNAQRRDGRDQHVVSEMRRIELVAALDASVVSCESCGFLVVDSGSFCWWRSDLDPPTRACVCGGQTAVFVEHVPGNAAAA